MEARRVAPGQENVTQIGSGTKSVCHSRACHYRWRVQDNSFCSHVLCLHQVAVPLVGSFLAWLGGACNTVHFVVQTTEQVKEEWSSVAGGGGEARATLSVFLEYLLSGTVCTGPWLTSTLWLSQVSFILFVLFCWKWKKRCVLSNLVLSIPIVRSDSVHQRDEREHPPVGRHAV